MRKRVKLLMLAVVFCLAFSGITVSAADDRLGTVVDGSLLTDGSEVTFSVSPKARGVFLASGSGGLSIAGSRYLYMTGDTCCYNSVDKLSVTLYLQRLEGNSWVHVATISKTAYNTYYVTRDSYKTVTGGYYYRLYGGHAAIDNGTSEALTSYTDGLWVD